MILCNMAEEEVNVMNSSAHFELLQSFRNRGWILDFEVDITNAYLKVYGHIKKEINISKETSMQNQ